MFNDLLSHIAKDWLRDHEVDLQTIRRVLIREQVTELEIECLQRMTSLENVIVESVESIDLSFLKHCPQITRFSYGRAFMENLDFLDNIESLSKLSLYSDNAVDIEPILRHRHLKELVFQSYIDETSADYPDVGRFCVLTELTKLGVYINYPFDLRQMGSHPQLESLDVTGSTVGYVGCIGDLKHLSKLSLSYQGAADFTGMGELTTLEELDLNLKGELRIPSLKKLKKLKKIRIGDPRVEFSEYTTSMDSLSWLSGHPRITNVSLTGVHTEDWRGLQEMPKLEVLVMWNCHTVHLDTLANCAKLSGLGIHDSSVIVEGSSVSFSSLSSAGFHNSKFSEWGGRVDLPNVRGLSLTTDTDSDLEPYGRYVGISKLKIKGNGTWVPDLSLLAPLKNVLYLDMENFSDFDATPLSNFEKLDDVKFTNTSLKSLEFVRGCKKLRYLSIAETAITDLSPLLADVKRFKIKQIYLNKKSFLPEQLIELQKKFPNVEIFDKEPNARALWT